MECSLIPCLHNEANVFNIHVHDAWSKFASWHECFMFLLHVCFIVQSGYNKRSIKMTTGGDVPVVHRRWRGTRVELRRYQTEFPCVWTPSVHSHSEIWHCPCLRSCSLYRCSILPWSLLYTSPHTISLAIIWLFIVPSSLMFGVNSVVEYTNAWNTNSVTKKFPFLYVW